MTCVIWLCMLLICCCLLISDGKLLQLRSLVVNHTLDELRAKDQARHTLIYNFPLNGSRTSGVINFPLNGSFDPDILGIYYAEVNLGSPPKKYHMLVDTGSSISWISCKSCKNCPRSSGIGIEMHFYDTDSSSTATIIPCSAPICSDDCSKTKQCTFSENYGDGSTIAGYYVADLLHLDTIQRNSSAPIVFGCTTFRDGNLEMTDSAVDGLLGFDRGDISIISQLSSRGISPKSFSHCLNGESSGGGVLMLGEVLHPSMVYTPLVPSSNHYNVYLQSITINRKRLAIDPAVFATSDHGRGTIFDSGTSLVHLVEEAYKSVLNVITTTVSPSAQSIKLGQLDCFQISSSLSNNIKELFPTISLNFAGGASMDLTPVDYLKDTTSFDGVVTWCIFFVTKDPSLTILGGAALKNKIIVYDLARQRVGWANHNCSLSVNVSIASSADEVTRATFVHILVILCIYLRFVLY